MANHFGADGKISEPQNAPSSSSATPQVSSSMSTSAATFVPGKTLSAGASAFVPSTRAEAFVPAKTVWTPSAAEFVPGQAFVPGQSTWSTANSSASWQQGFQGSYGSGAYSMYGTPSYTSSSGVPFTLGTGVQCAVNLDGYETDSDSSSPSPRERPSKENASTAPVPAKVEDEKPKAELNMVEVNRNEENSKTKEERECDVKPEETSVNATPPVIDTHPAAPPTLSISPSASPTKERDSEFYSPLNEPLGSEEGRSGTTSDHEAEDLNVVLPPAAQPDDCPIIEAAVIAERSDRTLKQWLQRFANDNDSELFRLQWQKWTCNGSGEPLQEIILWLLRHGLEDCRAATSVCMACDLLLREEGLPAATLQSGLATFSEDDLADLELDNPKVREFVSEMHSVLSNLPAVITPKLPPVKKIAETSGVAIDATYTPETLIQIRRRLVLNGEINEYTGPRWITESATKSCGPMPSWQQNRLARSSKTSDTAEAEPPSHEWRDAQKRNMESRSKGKNSGKTGRQKEAIQVTETSWVAQSRRWKADAERDDAEQDAIEDEQFLREMRLTLNKLTVEKFDHLSDRLVQLISESTRPNRGIPVLMQLVFEKATTQHHFIDMYADLCSLLHSHFAVCPVIDDPKMNFKKILLTCCQVSFEKHLKPPGSLASMDKEERLTAERMYKMRMIGNIRFVGALLVRKMLASKVALAIMEELLQDPTPEALESLAALLTSIGASFDHPEWAYRTTLNAVFKQAERLAKKSSTESRLRYLLKDVLDLRNSGWKDMRPKKIEGPKKLDEVAMEDSNGNSKKAVTSDGWAVVSGPRLAKPSSPSAQAEFSVGKQPSFSMQAKAAEKTPEKVSKGSSAGKAMLDFLKNRDEPKPKDATPFDRDAFRTEVATTLAELRVSHDVAEAILRIGAIAVPVNQQSAELCDLLSKIVEEGSQDVRKVEFQLVASLYKEGRWKPESAAKGVRSFVEDICPDLKCDVPNLPQILREELHPSLQPLVIARLLQADQLKSLLAAM